MLNLYEALLKKKVSNKIRIDEFLFSIETGLLYIKNKNRGLLLSTTVNNIIRDDKKLLLITTEIGHTYIKGLQQC